MVNEGILMEAELPEAGMSLKSNSDKNSVMGVERTDKDM